MRKQLKTSEVTASKKLAWEMKGKELVLCVGVFCVCVYVFVFL